MMNLITDRNRDFMARCQEIARNWNENHPPTRQQIVDRALTSVAPGYYVTFDHAYNCILRLRNGNLPHNTSPIKRQMWIEINEKVVRYQEKHQRVSTPDALSMVLTTKASRYFISPTYAIRLFYHLNNPYESRKKNSPYHNTRTADSFMFDLSPDCKITKHRDAC